MLKNKSHKRFMAGLLSTAMVFTSVNVAPMTVLADSGASALANGDYYIVNAVTGEFLNTGLWWGTHAKASNAGQLVTITAKEEGSSQYAVNTHFYNNDNKNSGNHYLAANGYVDSAVDYMTIESAGDGTYTIVSSESKYLTAPAEGNYDIQFAETKSDASEWRFLTKTQLEEEAVAATENNKEYDVTSLLYASDFSYSDVEYLGKWSGEYGRGGFRDGNDSNYVVELGYKKAIDCYQEINVPNGIYQVSAQGYWRNEGDADETKKPVLYANESKKELKNVFDEAKDASTGGWDTNRSGKFIPNGMTAAARCFAAGGYSNEPVEVAVTDGKLRVGVKAEAPNYWVCFDNFTIVKLPTYDVTYELNGGSSEGAIALTDVRKLPDEFPTATKNNREFGGWFTDAELTTPAVAGAEITADTTLYAKWIKGAEPDVLLGFDFNEGETTDGATITGTNATATVHSGCELVDSKEGNGKALKLTAKNAHEGQYISIDNAAALLKGKNVLTISYDIVKGAGNWNFYIDKNNSNNVYQKEYYLGAFSGSTVFERYVNGRNTPVSGKIEGVTLADGWNHLDIVATDEGTWAFVNGTFQKFAASTGSLTEILGDDTVLYLGRANWDGGEYGNATMDNFTVYDGVPSALAEQVFDSAAKVEAIATVDVKVGAESKNVSATVSGVSGVADLCKVTYASNDDTIATVDENGVVTAVAEGQTTVTTTATVGTKTKTATTTVNVAANDTFDITYDTKGGKTVAATAGVKAIPAAEELPVPTKYGYVFTGWFTDEDCTVAAVSGTTITANTVLYAGWEKSEKPYIADGDYFLRNVSTGTYLNGGNNWGTQESLTVNGQLMTIKADTEDDTLYTIDSHISNGGAKHFVHSGEADGDGYLDGVAENFVIDKLENGHYTISVGTQKYLSAPAEGTVCVWSSAKTEASEWEVISRDALIKEAVALVASGQSVDLTSLVGDPDFGRNNQYFANWSGGLRKEGNGDKNHSDDNVEKYKAVFDAQQVITDLPNGKYEVTVQGYYRDESETQDSQAVVLYANGNEKALKSIWDEAKEAAETGWDSQVTRGTEANNNVITGYVPNSQGEAADAFGLGGYKSEAVEAIVKDGTLTLGVKAVDANNWVCFDKVTLTLTELLSDEQIFADATVSTAKEAEVAVGETVEVPVTLTDVGNVKVTLEAKAVDENVAVASVSTGGAIVVEGVTQGFTTVEVKASAGEQSKKTSFKVFVGDVDQVKADLVKALIDAISDGELTKEDAASVNEAKRAYDSLTEEQKEKVDGDKVTKLNNALDAIKGLVTLDIVEKKADVVAASGTKNWNADSGNTDDYTKALDGNFGTFFDGLENGNVTVDLGRAYKITGFAVAPRSGYEYRMPNASVYGSNDNENWTKLYTMPGDNDKDSGNQPKANVLTTVKASEFETAQTVFRYVKYETPSGDDNAYCCNIAEFEVYRAVIDKAYVQNYVDYYTVKGSQVENAEADAKEAFDAAISTAQAVAETLPETEEEMTVDQINGAVAATVAVEKAFKELSLTKEQKDAIADVENKINALGTITLESKDAIDAAKKAYDALSDSQKELVTNYSTLTDAQAAYDVLKKADDERIAAEEEAKKNKAAADGVIGLIDAIGTVTADSRNAIDTARAAYKKLTAAQKKLVTNYDKLTAAEKDIKAIEANKAVADEVADQISKIGDVTLNSKDAIDAAKAAYEALSDEQKALVPAEVKNALKAAEAAYNKAVADKKAADDAVNKVYPSGTTAKTTTAKFVISSDNAAAPECAFSAVLNAGATTVVIPEAIKIGNIVYKVTAIADDAFKGCANLTSVTIPNSVTVIGRNSFAGCKKLKSITIPANVTQIGVGAFSGAKKLKTITIQSTVLKKVGKKAFKGIKKNAKIKVPKKKKKAYKKLLANKGQAETVKIK